MLHDKIFVDGELFLGRLEEQGDFRQALRHVLNPDPSLQKPYIYLVEGDVGMGKSQLLRRLRDIAARELPFETAVQTMLVDWGYKAAYGPARLSYLGPDQPNYIFEELYTAARDAGWGHQFTDYQENLRRLIQLEKQVSEAIEQEVWDYDFGAIRLASTDEVIAALRADDQPVGGVGAADSPSAEATGETPDSGNTALVRSHVEEWYIAEGFFEPEEDELFLRPNSTIAGLVGIGFAKQSQTKPLVVLLDAFEFAGRGGAWIQAVIRNAGPKVVWVIATDKEFRSSAGYDLRALISPLTDKLKVVELGCLTEDQATIYLQNRSPDRMVTRSNAEQMYAVTRGLPLALQLGGDLWAGGVPVADLTDGISPDAPNIEILETLSQRLLDFSSDPEDRRTLIFLAIQPRPSESIFSAVLQPRKGSYEMQTRVRMLTTRYKAIQGNGVLELHRFVAQSIRSFLLRRRIRISEEVGDLAALAAAVAEKNRENLESNFPRLEDRFENEEWRTGMLDSLYWTFLKNEFDGWRQINRDFIDAIGYDLAHAQQMVSVVERIESLLSKNGQQRLEVYQTGLATQIANRKGEVPKSLGELDVQVSLLAELERWLTRYGGKDIYATERRAILDLRRGELFYRYGQYEDAMKMFLSAEKNLPARGIALSRQVAEDFERVGQMMAWQWDGARILDSLASPRAETTLKKAIVLGRRRAAVFHALGSVQMKLGKPDNALENLLQAVTLNPDNQRAWFDLAEIYRGQKLFDKALPAYKRAISLDPKFVQARFGLALSLRELGQEEALNEELQVLKRLVATQSEYLQACYEALAGNHQKAVGYLETAIKAEQATMEMVRREACFDSLRTEERFLILANS